MSITQLNSILIIDPNQALTGVTAPYSYFKKTAKIYKAESLSHTLRLLSKLTPDIILCSTTTPMNTMLRIMEAISVKSRHLQKIIPLVLVIDQTQAWSEWPGSFWGNHLGITFKDTSKEQFLEEVEHAYLGRN